MKYLLITIPMFLTGCNSNTNDIGGMNADIVTMLTAAKISTSKEACFHVSFYDSKNKFLDGNYCVKAIEGDKK